MKVQCTCGKEYDVSEQLVGKSVRCQVCSNRFIVPAPPGQQPTLQMTIAASIPLAAPQMPQTPSPATANQPTQWVSGPIPSSDPKAREEREQQLIAQYVPYQPKAGSKLRGSALQKAIDDAARKKRRLGAIIALSIGGILAVLSAVSFFLFPLEEATADGGGLSGLMYSIGGKWAIAILIGGIALLTISGGLVYWLGAMSRKKAG